MFLLKMVMKKPLLYEVAESISFLVYLGYIYNVNDYTSEYLYTQDI